MAVRKFATRSMDRRSHGVATTQPTQGLISKRFVEANLRLVYNSPNYGIFALDTHSRFHAASSSISLECPNQITIRDSLSGRENTGQHIQPMRHVTRDRGTYAWYACHAHSVSDLVVDCSCLSWSCPFSSCFRPGWGVAPTDSSPAQKKPTSAHTPSILG